MEWPRLDITKDFKRKIILTFGIVESIDLKISKGFNYLRSQVLDKKR